MTLEMPGTEVLAWLKSPPAPTGQGPIVIAALVKRRCDLVRRAIEEGMLDPEIELQGSGLHGLTRTAHLAAVFGAVPLLRFLIDRNIDLSQCTAEGWAPLHLAIENKHESAALFLIYRVPSTINAHTNDGTTPLMLAAGKGMLDVMKALVWKGAEVEAQDSDGDTAIFYAAEAGREEAMVYLLEMGAVWPGWRGWDGLIQAASDGAIHNLVKSILRRLRAGSLGEDELAEQMGGAAVLAVGRGNMPALRGLIEDGLDLTQPVLILHERERIPIGLLRLACEGGNGGMAAFLVEHGADPLQPGIDGLMPHHHAAFVGHLSILQLLLARFPDILHVDTQAVGDNAGVTALQFAAEGGHMDVVKWLVGHGADVLGAVCDDGVLRRPSELADKEGHSDVATFLREKEAAALADRVAAERKARNERRRQKQKKAKARRQQQQQQAGAAAAGAGGGEGREEKEAEDEEQHDGEAVLATTEAALATDGAAAKQEYDKAEKDSKPPAATALSSASLVQAPQRPPPLEAYLDLHAPEALLCPITFELLADPVTLVADGCTYSRTAIEEHFDRCRRHNKPIRAPKTNLDITDPADSRLAPAVLVRNLVVDYKAAKTLEWEAAEQRWREHQDQHGQEGMV